MKHDTLLSTQIAAQITFERRKIYLEKLLEMNDITPAKLAADLKAYRTICDLLKLITPQEFETILQRAKTPA